MCARCDGSSNQEEGSWSPFGHARASSGPPKKLLYGVTLYDPGAVASLLKRAGFTNVRIEKYPYDKPMDSNLAVGTAGGFRIVRQRVGSKFDNERWHCIDID